MFLETVNTLSPGAPSVPTSLGVAVISAYCLDFLKRMKSVPLVSYYSTKMNTYLRMIMALGGTLGISWAWSSSTAGEGYHQLALTIPPLAVLMAGLWHCAVQYGIQHLGESVLQIYHQMPRMQVLPVQTTGKGETQ